MTNEDKNHDEQLRQEKENEKNVQQKKEKLEELRRWFETQGDCT